ncbi:MAG: hypothetical protein ACRDBY_08690 [Cetobacterium sp.]
MIHLIFFLISLLTGVVATVFDTADIITSILQKGSPDAIALVVSNCAGYVVVVTVLVFFVLEFFVYEDIIDNRRYRQEAIERSKKRALMDFEKRQALRKELLSKKQ